MKSYAESCARPNTTPTMTLFYRARVFVLASNHGATEKQIPPADFSTAVENLFNVSSFGLDRDVEGRSCHTRDA